MKRLLFLIAFLGTMGSLWAQATENLFEWQGGNRIIPNGKFLEKYKGIYTDYIRNMIFQLIRKIRISLR